MKDENVAIEYKKSLSQLKEGVISLSSMLNKNHSGELYFGITPDKKPFKFDFTIRIWPLKPTNDILNLKLSKDNILNPVKFFYQIIC